GQPHGGRRGGCGETIGQGCLTDRQSDAGRRASHADRGGTDAGRRCAAAAGPPNDVARAYQNLAIPPPVDGAPGAPTGVADSRKEGDQTVRRKYVQPALVLLAIVALAGGGEPPQGNYYT